MDKTYQIYTSETFPQDAVLSTFKDAIELLTPYERFLLHLKYFRTRGKVLTCSELAQTLGYGATQALQNRYQHIITKINGVSDATWPHLRSPGDLARNNPKLYRQLRNRGHTIRECPDGRVVVHYGPDGNRRQVTVFANRQHVPLPVTLPEFQQVPAPSRPLVVAQPSLPKAAGAVQTPAGAVQSPGRFAAELAARREAARKLAAEIEVLEAAERLLKEGK